MFFSQFINSQIGINTENIPSGVILHIDSKKNNPTTIGVLPSAEEALDDVVYTYNGNLGIGTVSPTAKLHLVTGGTASAPNPQFRLKDNINPINWVLTSDVNGIGNFQEYIPGVTLGVFDITGVDMPISTTVFKNTKAMISLLPRKWLVSYNLLISSSTTSTIPFGYRYWVRSTLGDDSTLTNGTLEGTAGPDLVDQNVGGSNIWFNSPSVVSAYFFVNNTTGSTKNYYLLVGNILNTGSINSITLLNVGADNDNSSFYAFRIQ